MALDFAAGCLGGCAGVLVGHPFDTVKVNLQTQDHRNPKYHGTFHCLKTIASKESVRGLYRGMSSPMAGVAFVNAIVFGVYGNVQRRADDPNSLKSHFVAGSLAGLAQSVICSPMELAKTQLQLQPASAAPKYKGPSDVLAHIWKEKGFRGVFRGLGITAARDIPGFSSYFVAYELMVRHKENPSSLHILMAGGLAGTFSWLTTFPIDTVKSRLQADKTNKYDGIRDCIVKSYREEGLRFFSRGLGSTLIRAFPMNAACFLVVSWVMKFCENNPFQSSVNQLQLTSPASEASHFNVIGSMGNPMICPKFREHHRHQTIRGVVAVSSFNEVICSSEIHEMACDFYDGASHYYAFNVNGPDPQMTHVTNDHMHAAILLST